MKNIDELECCPHCGHDEWYRKQRASGTLIYRYMFDGSEADNSELYTPLNIVDIGKFAYCGNCEKKIGLLVD